MNCATCGAPVTCATSIAGTRIDLDPTFTRDEKRMVFRVVDGIASAVTAKKIIAGEKLFVAHKHRTAKP